VCAPARARLGVVSRAARRAARLEYPRAARDSSDVPIEEDSHKPVAPIPTIPIYAGLYTGPGSTPVPDPTLLTTAALTREISALRDQLLTRLDAMDKAQELFDANLNRVPSDVDRRVAHLRELHETKFQSMNSDVHALEEVIGVRFNGMDRAVELLQNIENRFPAKVDEKIASLAALHEEKFNSIEKQFKERDVRTEQSSKDSKVAVDAALQAAKEAVGEQNKSSALAIAKSETSTVKQIDQLGVLIQTSNKALDDKISDIKERLTRVEGKGEGQVAAKTNQQAAGSYASTIIMAVIAVIALAVSVMIAMRGGGTH